jgi:hypothetical protein
MPKECSVISVVKLAYDSFLFGFSQKSNALHPRVVVARWDTETYHWVDTVPNCVYGNWHVWPDGSFWIGSRSGRIGAWENGTSFKHYAPDGEVLAEWIGPYQIDGFLGANNEWAIFQPDQCYLPGLKATMIPGTRLFGANGGRFVEREWPKGWGCLTAIVNPQNELWCFGSECISDDEPGLCSPNWDKPEILFEDGDRIDAPSFGYKFSPRTKAIFANDGWFYISGVTPYYLYAAKLAEIRSKSPKWKGLLDVTKKGDYEIAAPACLVSSSDGTALIGSDDGYVEAKGGKIIRSDDIIETSRPSIGIMLPQHFVPDRGWIIQGTVKYGANPQGGVRFIPQDTIGTGESTWQEIDSIPNEWFTRKPKRVSKSLQRRLEFEQRNIEPE